MSAVPSGLLTASRFTEYSTRPSTSLYGGGARFDATSIPSKYFASSNATRRRPYQRRPPSNPSASDSESESSDSAGSDENHDDTITPPTTTAPLTRLPVPPSLFNSAPTNVSPTSAFDASTPTANFHPAYMPFSNNNSIAYTPAPRGQSATPSNFAPQISPGVFRDYARSMIAQTIGLPVEQLTSWSQSELAANLHDILAAAPNRSPLPFTRDDSDRALKRTMAATAIGADPLDNSLSDSAIDDILQAARTQSRTTTAPTTSQLLSGQPSPERRQAATILERHTDSLELSDAGVQDVLDNYQYQSDTEPPTTATMGHPIGGTDAYMAGGLGDPLATSFRTNQRSPQLKTMRRRVARKLGWDKTQVELDNETLRELYYAHQNVRSGEAGPSRIWSSSNSDSEEQEGEEEEEKKGFEYDESALDDLVIDMSPSVAETAKPDGKTTSPPLDDRSRPAEESDISAALAYKRREQPDTTPKYIDKQPAQRIRDWASKSREPTEEVETAVQILTDPLDELRLDRRYTELDEVDDPFARPWGPEAHSWRHPESKSLMPVSAPGSTLGRYAQVEPDLDDPYNLWTAYQSQVSSSQALMV